MSDATKYIHGMGAVITSPDAFDDHDAFVGDRLAPRRNDAPAVEEDADSDYPTPQKASVRGWGNAPSIASQALKAPSTVRAGPLITTVLDLSVSADLQTLNDLHAKAVSLDGPFVEIHHIDKKFHEGKWHALVSHSVISYQQL